MKIQLALAMMFLAIIISGCGQQTKVTDTGIVPVSTRTTSPLEDDALSGKTIKRFASDPSLEKNYQVIARAGRSPSQRDELLSKYEADGDTYLMVDANTVGEFLDKSIDAGMQPKIGKVLSSNKLEDIAKKIIQSNVNIDTFTAAHTNKLGTNYFFRWEDRSKEKFDGQNYPYVQVAIRNDGWVYSYTNILR